MPEEKNKRRALVLSAGGARAAYQVGVLKFVGEHFPDFNPKIISGVSAGAINAAFLAQGKPFAESSAQMARLWSELKFEKVMKTNFKTVFSVVRKLANDLFFSKITHKVKFTSLLDASPLGQTLKNEINFQSINNAIQEGLIEGVSVTATNYKNGYHTIFFDSHHPVEPWLRHNRIAVRAPIRLKHVIASCSIPILFDPVRLGDEFYGDGALGFGFPFSPAIHMGATDLFGIGLSSPQKDAATLSEEVQTPSLGYVAGAVLNSIFVDSLAPDYELLSRMNSMAEDHAGIKKVSVILISPSQDLGTMAQDYIEEVPFHVKQLLKASATSPTELGTLISYLMFTKGYLNALIELGVKDAEANYHEIESFMKSPEPATIEDLPLKN